jgi:hypothetical protein
LSILLYGSEIWCLREDLFNRLRQPSSMRSNYVPHYQYIMHFALCKKSNSTVKTEIFRDYGAAEAPPGLQAGWSC